MDKPAGNTHLFSDLAYGASLAPQAANLRNESGDSCSPQQAVFRAFRARALGISHTWLSEAGSGISDRPD